MKKPNQNQDRSRRLLQIPSPGGKVAPKGSEEECGQKSESQYTSSDLRQGWSQDERSTRSSEGPSSNITARTPLQSPIGSEEPIGDSFPPVEALGAPRRLRICAVLLALFLLFECTYCVAVFTDWVPALTDLRNQYIETALGTMNHKWLATAFIPGDIVMAVKSEMDAAREAQLGQNSSGWETEDIPQNRDFFELFPELEPSAVRAWSPVPEAELEGLSVNYAGLDEVGLDLDTRQGDQVLAIDAKNGLLVVRIREEFFRGVLILGKDPGRLSCAAAENWGVSGQRAGQIAEDHDALVALTASGFEADGPEGAYQTGASMCGGIAYGDHLKPGYKRLELRTDDRLYVTDAPEDFHPACTDAAEWTPALIVDGKIVVTKEDHYNARNPRCCLGQAADGTVLMLCIEGRYFDSLGATAPECAEILARYGACQAMNLDGGTSAICWYQGEYITRCSDPDLPEGRLLPNAWIYRGIEN